MECNSQLMVLFCCLYAAMFVSLLPPLQHTHRLARGEMASCRAEAAAAAAAVAATEYKPVFYNRVAERFFWSTESSDVFCRGLLRVFYVVCVVCLVNSSRFSSSWQNSSCLLKQNSTAKGAGRWRLLSSSSLHAQPVVVVQQLRVRMCTSVCVCVCCNCTRYKVALNRLQMAPSCSVASCAEQQQQNNSIHAELLTATAALYNPVVLCIIIISK